MTAGFATLNDRRAATSTRQANGVKVEAGQIGEAAFALFRKIKASHGDTRTAFAKARDPTELHKIEVALLTLMQSAATICDDPRHIKPAKLGRTSSRAAQMIADFVLHTFESVTESRATITTRHDKVGNPAEGPFLTLLKAVFGLFGVKASAEAQGKAAIRRRTAGHKPGGAGGLVTIRFKENSIPLKGA